MTRNQRSRLVVTAQFVEHFLSDSDGAAFADINTLEDASLCLKATSDIVESWLRTARKIPVGRTDDF